MSTSDVDPAGGSERPPPSAPAPRSGSIGGGLLVSWLVRAVGIVIVGALTAGLGRHLLLVTTPPDMGTRLPRLAPEALSAALWLVLAIPLRRSSAALAIGVGVLASFIGALCLGGFRGAVVIAAAPQVVLLGTVAALTVREIARGGDSVVASRRRRGLCHRCAYDLRGHSSPVCPECGTPVLVALPRPPAWIPMAVLGALLTTLVGLLMLLPAAVVAGGTLARPGGIPPGTLLCTSGAAVALAAIGVALDIVRPAPVGPRDSPPDAEVFRMRRQVWIYAIGLMVLPIASVAPLFVPGLDSPLADGPAQAMVFGGITAGMFVGGAHLALLIPRYRLTVTRDAVVEQGVWRRRRIAFDDVVDVRRPTRHVTEVRAPGARLHLSDSMFTAPQWRRVHEAMRRRLPAPARARFDAAEPPLPRSRPVRPIVTAHFGAIAVVLSVMGYFADLDERAAEPLAVVICTSALLALGLGGIDLVRARRGVRLSGLAMMLGLVGAAGAVLVWLRGAGIV